VSFRDIPTIGSKKLQFVGERSCDLVELHRGHVGGGKLDGKWKSFQPTADRRDLRDVARP
jgi:hypothetical protein